MSSAHDQAFGSRASQPVSLAQVPVSVAIACFQGRFASTPGLVLRIQIELQKMPPGVKLFSI
jgi:hypothetical protein